MAWYLKSKEVVSNPNIKIQSAYVVAPDGKALPPGAYTFSKGTTVHVVASLVNKGGAGHGAFVVYDFIRNKVLYNQTYQYNAGQSRSFSVPIHVDSDYKIAVRAYSYIVGKGWVKTDERGC